MTLFWDPTGPLVYYTGGTFGVEDLNPSGRMRWRMSRWEMLCMGLRCVWASVVPLGKTI
jgi:hypothetical protein